jgi:hypothetical protein
VTPENFEQFCKDICPHCANGSAVRLRLDSMEWVHDTSIEIPGTLGKRQGHAFCLASNFRKKYKDVAGG